MPGFVRAFAREFASAAREAPGLYFRPLVLAARWARGVARGRRG